jgi:fluoride ion exporter CrcB/FEX
MFLRALAIAAGTALVAAAAYASLAQVEAGPASPYGVITIVVAGGLIVGALCVGAASAVGRRSIALAIALGMVCGERSTP